MKRFSCNNTALDAWLQNTSRQHQQKNLSRTFVLVQDCAPATIIGYYALAIRGLTLKEALPQTLQKSLPLNIPAMTLARLAVAHSEQKKGYGELLLLDAMARIKAAASLIGGSLLFVDAKNAESAAFYARYGFVALPDNPLTLGMRVADLP
ncbi:MAG: GNAT family N-acetyltransferase [Methylovulum sp.]|nr:GNAT family N-acetyltransferase [Methylovulum sp.]